MLFSKKNDMKNDFINLKLTKKNLDNYYIRQSIFEALNNSIEYFKGELLDAGCGKMPYKEYLLTNSAIDNYIGLDIDNALIYDEQIKPDYTWDGFVMPFPDNQFDTIISIEVLEHCPDSQVYMNECYRVLKKGGFMFFTTPFLWPLHEVPHDEFRYTPFALKRIFQKAGFNNIEIKALGGWNASFATMLGLWCNRYLKGFKSKLFQSFIKPIMSRLISKDVKPKEFEENSMITGIYGIIKKKL